MDLFSGSSLLPGTLLLAVQPTEDDGTSDGEDAWSVLSGSERLRAARFHFEHDRHRWINGRAWVRHQLGAVLGLSPEAVEIAAEPGGRLYVPGAVLDFNLSHTGGWIALGICQDGRLGVDLETIDPTFPALEIASEFFLPEERDWIAAGPADRFFHLWTAKEALMKATGRGMSLPPDKIHVTIKDGQPATVTNLETGETHPVTTRPGPGSTILATVHLPTP
ncbi:MAG: 4'-phosphopantetheinyl transferase superfamily protein [Verrucomicrobiota bacterium]